MRGGGGAECVAGEGGRPEGVGRLAGGNANGGGGGRVGIDGVGGGGLRWAHWIGREGCRLRALRGRRGCWLGRGGRGAVGGEEAGWVAHCGLLAVMPVGG